MYLYVCKYVLCDYVYEYGFLVYLFWRFFFFAKGFESRLADGLASEKKPCQLSVFLVELMRVLVGCIGWPLTTTIFCQGSRIDSTPLQVGKASQIRVRVAERKSHKRCAADWEPRDLQTLETDMTGQSDIGGPC